MNPRARLLAAPFAVALLFGATSCSDDTKDAASDAVDSAGEDVDAAVSEAQDDADEVASDVSESADSVVEDAEDGIGAAGARAQAEALRASLKGNDTANAEGVRSMTAIQEAAEDLPGDVEVSGVDDGDGDGLDDDGRVQVDQGDQSACLVLPAEGEDTTVEAGTC